MLWGNTVYCMKLSGEDLSRYSNKIENVRIITILLRKRCHNNKHFAEPPRHGGGTAGIDMVWRNYVTHSHPMYSRKEVNFLVSTCRTNIEIIYYC